MPSNHLAAAFLKLFSQSRSYISSFNREFNKGVGLFLTRMTLLGACLSTTFKNIFFHAFHALFISIPLFISGHEAFSRSVKKFSSLKRLKFLD